MMRAFFVHPGFVRLGIGCRILALSEAGATAAGFKKIEIIATLPSVLFCSTFSNVSVERFYITPPSGAAMPVERMRKHFGSRIPARLLAQKHEQDKTARRTIIPRK